LRSKRKTYSILDINLKRILEYTIGELIDKDHMLLHYRVRAEIKRLRSEYRILKIELDRISKRRLPYDEDYRKQIEKRLEDAQRCLETLERVGDKIKILSTINDVEKEYGSEDKELWSNVRQIKIRDILNYEGDIEDRKAVFDFLVRSIKGFPHEKPLEKGQLERQPKVVSIGEKEYIVMKTEEWIGLLNKCFGEDKQIELPDNYLAENLRRPLRSLIIALLEMPPESIRRVIPKKYKFLLVANDIFYTLIKEDKVYEITPGSSEKGYIEEIFSIFQATEIETRKVDGNIIRKIYGIRIGEQEYRIMRETLLEGGRAKLVRYTLIK